MSTIEIILPTNKYYTFSCYFNCWANWNIYSLDFLCSCQFLKKTFIKPRLTFLNVKNEGELNPPPAGSSIPCGLTTQPIPRGATNMYMFVVAKLCAAYCRLLNENWSRKYEHCALNKNFAKFVSENIPRSELSNPQYIGGCLVYTVYTMAGAWGGLGYYFSWQ